MRKKKSTTVIVTSFTPCRSSVANRSPLVDIVVSIGEPLLLVVLHYDIIALLQADLDDTSTHQSSTKHGKILGLARWLAKSILLALSL